MRRFETPYIADWFAASLRWIVLATLVVLPTVSQAQPYPSKPIRLIVPFPPGGNVDLSARILAPELSKELGQPIVIDNKAGAGGTLGLDAVAKSPPDGYTLGVASPVNHLAAPSLYPKLPYDSIKDFTPVGLIASVPMVLVVGPSSPAKSQTANSPRKPAAALPSRPAPPRTFSPSPSPAPISAVPFPFSSP